MARVITWLLLVFVVLLALRVVSARHRRRGATAAAPAPSAEAMVRCLRCGVFLPRSEAKKTADGYVCATEHCIAHG